MPAPLPRLCTGRRWPTRAAHRVLGCRGVSQADFRLDETEPGRPVPAGGEYPARHDALSLVPEQAAHVGIGFADLVEQLVEAARCDT